MPRTHKVLGLSPRTNELWISSLCPTFVAKTAKSASCVSKAAVYLNAVVPDRP